MPLRVLHFSDPHFTRIVRSPTQFLSKQWLGNLNYILFRRGAYQTTHLKELPPLATSLGVNWIIASGDFSSTSQPIEFQLAKDFIDQFQQPVITLPGNHDAYTKKAEVSKRYYTYFPSEQMEATYVEKRLLAPGWWWVGLDCARANSLLKSNGVFRKEMDRHLETALGSIPKGERVIIGNHFPLYPWGRPAHDTERASVLQAILHTYSNVSLYLHGHDHKPYIIDAQVKGDPLVLNPGSIAHLPGGTFYLLDLDESGCQLQRYLRTDQEKWVIDLKRNFLWRPLQ